MRKVQLFFVTIILVSIVHDDLRAQSFLNRIKQKAQDKLNQKVDNTVDQSMDKALNPSTSNQTQNNKNSKSSTPTEESGTTSTASTAKTIATYKNYDFVPGDKIILESQLSDERRGEIPSQFVLDKGQIDVQEEDGENVIHIPKGSGARFHLRLKNPTALPSQLTVEFDEKNTISSSTTYGIDHASVDFGYKIGNIYSEVQDVVQGVELTDNYVRWSMDQDIKYPEPLNTTIGDVMVWRHYAVAINQGSGKAYVDQYRVANVNNLEKRVVNIYFNFPDDQDRYVKNVRVAAGGMDLYKKVTTDNKIITHGILFDVDKATIQPQSMGTINGIYDLLKHNAALKFEIDGHTDNAGNATHNLTLSQSRAEAVKAQLVSMGIDAGRLTTKGFGDSKPLGASDTPEGKANNRRVEFVKM